MTTFCHCNCFVVAPKNLPKTLCKNSPKNPQKSGRQKSFLSDFLSRQFFGQKLLLSFNKILTKNLLKYTKTY